MREKQQRKKATADQNRFPLIATTLDGLEQTLAKELREIGGNDVEPGKRAVSFTGDLDLIYKANLRLRTALHVLKPLTEFEADSPEALYAGIRQIYWPEIFDAEQTFAVKAAVYSDFFTHSQYAALKVKDAIADHFREKFGARPNTDPKNPNFSIHIRISGKKVTVSLDSSGQSLHKRGYRQPGSAAPLNEALAAGIILNTNFGSHRPFIDPMCGSGTLPIEAALIANNIAPGLMRESFSFMHWRNYEADLFEVIREATINRISDNKVKIYGFDRNFRDIDVALQNARKAGVADMVQFERREFFASDPPEKFGTIVTNPPYDLRLKVEDITNFYRKIGDKLKQDYTGFSAYIFTANLEAMKAFGLRSSLKLPLKNGQVEARLFGFELYSGSKKSNKSQEQPEKKQRPRVARKSDEKESGKNTPSGPKPLKWKP